MSGTGPRRGLRRAAMLAPTTIRTATAEATPIRMARPVEMARGSVIASCHAEGTLGSLVDGVRPAGRAGDHGRRVDAHRGPRCRHLEPHEPGGSGPQLVLARVVVLRTVAGTFEPLALDAEGNPAAEVGALLVDGHEAPPGDLRREPGVEAVGAVPLVVDEVEATRAEVVGLPG